MNSRDVFEAHYRSAEVLLRVYRLLEAEPGPTQDHRLIPQFRNLIASGPDEELILLLNELFVGIVRERADVRMSFFRKDNLDLLLRQSVVAACSALDVFVPNLLQTYLPEAVRARQGSFIPNNGEVKTLFSDFRLKLEDVWLLAGEQSTDDRWNILVKKILDHTSNKTLSNDAGVAATLTLLGVDKPWGQIASRAGEAESAVREKLKRVVSRRNDIVHRADRARSDPNAVQSIDFVWTQNHVGVVRTIALACYDLARERIGNLTAAT